MLSFCVLLFVTIKYKVCEDGVLLRLIPVTTACGGDSLQIWTVATKILNNQSPTANMGWSFSLGVENHRCGKCHRFNNLFTLSETGQSIISVFYF
jgi:hypothetical protein